ncbi:MAG TPA: aminopeptidase P family N-terminal domain-containing protein [Pseudonocardiaceae bacterium]|nr:aminopeptidase P family N-terminal domain-containing protein [Pseudonocardiaceae bacterium]
MKRGLVVLDPAEVGPDEWRARVAAVRQTLASDGIDVALVYGDVFRSDDIAYLTNLCIYWNEGILAVPAAGDPVFLTKLSPRVHPWMRQVSTVSEIRSGRSFADLVATFLDGRPAGTVGLVESALWPAAVEADITAALAGWQVRRLGGLVRERRLVPSAAELALLERGGRHMATALSKATVDGLSVPERVGIVEWELRSAGFLDVLVHPATTTDGVVSLHVTGQYRTGWLQAGRLAGATDDVLRTALDAAVAAARPGATTSDLAGGLPDGATVSWANQADLATNGEYADHDTPMLAGSVVAITVDALYPDGGYAAVAETVLVGAPSTPLTTGSPA